MPRRASAAVEVAIEKKMTGASDGLKMTEHSFGGDWTEDTLGRLARYLTA
jgi:hypothetical protein